MATMQEYKCPCCGGAIEFDSGLQRLKCPYCDTEFEVDAIQGFNEDVKSDQSDDMRWQTQAGSAEWRDWEKDQLHGYVCRSCGGEIMVDDTTGATACPYCGNPVVLSESFTGDLRPDLVIPFQVDKKAAKEALTRHLQGKRLLPKIFKDQNHIDEIKGVYVPFWLFDADADARIRYKATRVHTWSDSNYNYTETQFYSVLRSGDLSFEAVPVDGSSKMPDDLMESIEPFDLSQAVDFQTAYLAGYLAERYDVNAQQSEERANQRIKNSTEDAFMNTVQGFTTVTPESSSVRLHNGKARYALYPVWLLTTTWQKKQYLFAMNGQTGKFVGNLPEDKSISRKLFWSIAGIGTAVLTVLQYVLWQL